MKTYELVIETHIEGVRESETHFFKTDASEEDIKTTVEFVGKGKRNIEGVLQGLRILGYKAQEVKVNPVDVFVM